MKFFPFFYKMRFLCKTDYKNGAISLSRDLFSLRTRKILFALILFRSSCSYSKIQHYFITLYLLKFQFGQMAQWLFPENTILLKSYLLFYAHFGAISKRAFQLSPLKLSFCRQGNREKRKSLERLFSLPQSHTGFPLTVCRQSALGHICSTKLEFDVKVLQVPSLLHKVQKIKFPASCNKQM